MIARGDIVGVGHIVVLAATIRSSPHAVQVFKPLRANPRHVTLVLSSIYQVDSLD